MSKFLSIVFISASLVMSATLPASSHDNGVAGLLHSLKIEGRKICMDGHFHYGSSPILPSKRAATISAIKDWRGFVEFEYGSDWTNFALAANRVRRCKPSGNGYWQCSVEGRPCKPAFQTSRR